MKFIASILCLFSFAALWQSQGKAYFEGKVIYTQLEKDRYGAMVPGRTLARTEASFKDTWYRYSVLDGSHAMLEAGDIIVNTAASTRYNVNSATYTATSLGVEPVMQGYTPIEITLMHDQDSVLGYPCRKYKVVQRAFIDGADKTSYVWAAKDLKVANLPLLAKMFGFQNTLLRNGSFGGLTLKVEVLAPDGSTALLISAVEVKPERLGDDLFQIPNSYKLK